jgi:hypothetical protein
MWRLLLCATLCLALQPPADYEPCRWLEMHLDDDAYAVTLTCDDEMPYNQLLACYSSVPAAPAAPTASLRSAAVPGGPGAKVADAADPPEGAIMSWEQAKLKVLRDLTSDWTNAKAAAAYAQHLLGRLWSGLTAPTPPKTED